MLAVSQVCCFVLINNCSFVFRKRLRAVCSEELPWRSQANLILSTCHLDVLLGRLPVDQANALLEPHLQRPHGLTFDAAGVIIDGVLPIHPPMVAGTRGGKVNLCSVQRCVELVTHY